MGYRLHAIIAPPAWRLALAAACVACCAIGLKNRQSK
jgi:hypothetical protein